jgi:uncharacterized protein HemX
MTSSKSIGIALFVMAILLAGGLSAQQQQKAAQQKATKIEKEEKEEKEEGQEAKLALKDLPKAVQATVQRETVGAEIVGISKETAEGKTIYEIETKVKGLARDMLIDEKGVLTEVEEETNLASLPAALQAEIKKSIGKAKLVKLETVLNGSKVKTGYSALVETGGKQSEVEMGLDGKPLAKGK